MRLSDEQLAVFLSKAFKLGWDAACKAMRPAFKGNELTVEEAEKLRDQILAGFEERRDDES